MDKTELARKWYITWSITPAAVVALRMFRELGGSNEQVTLERIARACFNAAHYAPERDPGAIYRNELRDEKKRLSQIEKAAHVLAMSARRNDRALSWAHDRAVDTSGVVVTRKTHDEPMAMNLVLGNYFQHLESALSGALPEIHGGPWLGRFTIGNLISNKPIARGRPVTSESMLGFEIALYLRMHTAGRATDGTQTGQTMPTDGSPCFPIVAAFCAAVFDTSWDAKQIGDKVRDLGKVGLNEWP